MRKILSVLLILGFVAGGVFAADLGDGWTIGGEVKAGVNVKSYDGDTFFSAHNMDAGKALRARLNFKYDSDIGGFSVRLQAINPDSRFPSMIFVDEDGNTLEGYKIADPITAVSLPFAEGYANLFNNKVRVVGGQMDTNAWGLGGLAKNAFDPNLDNGLGARVEVKPIDGLNVGLMLPLPTIANPYPITDAFNIVFGALYKAPVFQADAAVKIYGGDKDVVGYDPYIDLIAGVDVPLTNLGLNIVVDFRLESGDKGYFAIGPRVDYAKDALSAFGRIRVAQAQKDRGKKGEHSGEVEKGDDLSFGFELGADYKITSTITPYIRVGSDNVAWLDGNGLYIKPGATFALGPNTSIEIFDRIKNIGADGDLLDATGKSRNLKVQNDIQVDFVWSF
ncbi:hypothetical protein FACS189485_22470 [Spirochaetia bacterium]|nr:hypothetical protein FACS189485_22470 [Spirochaetia bacterium]